MYDVIELSKYIITKCKNDGQPIKNLQLQFILYAIQEQFLKQKRIAFENDFEAWKFGVCCPDAYYRFCGCGGMEIMFSYDTIEIDEGDKAMIDAIVEKKREENIWAKISEMHSAGSAWDTAFKDGGVGAVIPKLLILRNGKE